jgi:hypothetical protein
MGREAEAHESLDDRGSEHGARDLLRARSSALRDKRSGLRDELPSNLLELTTNSIELGAKLFLTQQHQSGRSATKGAWIRHCSIMSKS